MQLPNKLNSFQESSLPYFAIVLNELKNESINPRSLYRNIQKTNKKIDLIEFMDVLDSLFALGKIEMDLNTGVLKYVD